jgi:predicted RNA binding protein YcfA (HicA-like mRNA interferase family)
MPPKIKQLIRELGKAGFENLGGKGSQRKFRHACGAKITLSGNPGADAKPYQILGIRKVIELTKHENQ